METDFKIRLGGNVYVRTPNLIAYGMLPLFRVYRRDSDGRLGIDFEIYDQSQKKVGVVRNGVVVDGAADYEIQDGATEKSIRSKASGEVLARISRLTPGAELEIWVKTYLPNGQLLDAGPNKTNLGGSGMSGISIVDFNVGINIDP